jgi:hypothetical protein
MKRRLLWACGCAAASAIVLAAIPIVFGSPLPKISIQWRAVSDADRMSLERQFALTEPLRLSDDTWSYVPTDTSPPRIRSIVTHPLVADTDGINRRAFRISDSPPLTPRRGGLIDAPLMSRGARLLAYVFAALAVVFGLAAAVVSPLAPVVIQRARVVSGGLLSKVVRFTSVGRERLLHGQRPPWVVFLAASALFLAALTWRFLTFTGFTNDHYIHVALAQQVLLGAVPIRDFSDVGWPLMYLLSAGVWSVTGGTLGAEFAVAAGGLALGAALTVVAAYRLSRSLAVAVLVTMLEVLIFPRTYSYPKILMYAAAGCAILALAARPTRSRLILMALLIAAAFLFRHDHGLFIGLAALIGLIASSRDEGWRVGAQRALVLIAAIAVILLPWTLFVALNGGLVAYFQGGIDYSLAEAGATRLASWPVFDLNPPLTHTDNAVAWLFWLFWTLPLLSGAVALGFIHPDRERWPGERAAVLSLIVLAVLVNASFLRQTLQVRLADAIVPAALLGAWLLGLCWVGTWNRPRLQATSRLFTLIVLAVSLMAISRVVDLPGLYDNTDISRGWARVRDRTEEVWHLLGTSHRENAAPASRYAIALMPFLAYVDRCSLPTDRLIVTGEFPELLVLAGRGFAGDGVVLGSWYLSAAHEEHTLERLRSDAALFVIDAGDYAGFQNRFRLVDAYLREQYRVMAEVPVPDAPTARIMAPRERAPVRTDAQTGWPCYR